MGIRHNPHPRKTSITISTPQGAKIPLTNSFPHVIIDPNPTKFYTMSNLPITTPTETLSISPENLEIANCYLQLGTVEKVCENLEISREQVISTLRETPVKRYVDHVFMEMGFNNRVTMRSAMDSVLRQKFQELEEAGTGSSKDIADLLALSHKMTMEQLHLQLEIEKIRQKDSNIKNQVNVQINEGIVTDNSRYGDLINRLLGGGNA